MMKHWFLDCIARRGETPAFVSESEIVTYEGLADRVRTWNERLDSFAISNGDTVIVLGDHSASSFALLIALAARRAIIAPLTSLPRSTLADRCNTAGADWLVDCLDPDGPHFERFAPEMRPELGEVLRAQ